MTKQAIDFQKMTFSNWYNAVAMVQEQTTSVMDAMLEQNTWMPADGRKVVQSWLDACQSEQERFKTYLETSFTNLEKMVTKPKKSTPAKAK